ncbi:MAG: uncharacterized protein A8A55_0250 [Amphiamblys sp. WSBS2006]|nr:MAG: uncharacterized protein A8A55_0250 [Amphiamblys sp. WSBS2006]
MDETKKGAPPTETRIVCAEWLAMASVSMFVIFPFNNVLDGASGLWVFFLSWAIATLLFFIEAENESFPAGGRFLFSAIAGSGRLRAGFYLLFGCTAFLVAALKENYFYILPGTTVSVCGGLYLKGGEQPKR